MMAVFAGIIESATPVSFQHYYTYYWYSRLPLRYSETSRPLLYPKSDFYFDLIGISQDVYRAAVRDGKDIAWQCIVCVRLESYADPSSHLY